MLKKFLAAAILAVFLLSAQIAAAADVDWNTVRRVRNEGELFRYIEDCRQEGQTTFPVIFTNGFAIEQLLDEYISSDGKRHLNQFSDFIGVADIHYNGSWNQNGTEQFLNLNIGELPGTRVANAYLSYLYKGDMIKLKELNDKERTLFDNAQFIVTKAKKISSKEERAKYIYNELRKIRTKEGGYYQEKNKFDKNGIKPFATAIGALNNGQANCGGYTDAFYMLCRMAGLNKVYKFGGYINNNKEDRHGWNMIDFGDGKVYFVDVTIGIFKATSGELRQRSYGWRWNVIPNLQ